MAERDDPRPEGENHIRSIDRMMWELLYGVLVKFEWPVIFRHDRGDARCMTDNRFVWFVPEGSGKFEEIKAYIKQEMKDEIRKGSYDERLDHYDAGTTLEVYEFLGLEPYLEREPRRKMIEGAFKQFWHKLKQMTEPKN